MSNRAAIYGKVKQAAIQGQALGLTVNQTAKMFNLNPRSVRSVADHYKIKLKPHTYAK